MGYRLNIYKGNEYILENSKLYGYCDENKLKSYHYLIGIGKFTGEDEYFIDGVENAVELKAIELKKFIKYILVPFINIKSVKSFINTKKILI